MKAGAEKNGSGAWRVSSPTPGHDYEKTRSVPNGGSGKIINVNAYVLRHVSQSQVRSFAPFFAVASVHLLQPLVVPTLDVSAPVQLFHVFQASPARGASVVQREKHLVRNASGDVWDVDEGIGKWRHGDLVVLREWAGEDVETEGSRVGDDEVWDGRASIVYGQGIRYGLGGPNK